MQVQSAEPTDNTAVILLVIVAGLFLLGWWIKEHFDTALALAYITFKVLFYLAVIAIGIYCLMRIL